jgi:hypothetical protein
MSLFGGGGSKEAERSLQMQEASLARQEAAAIEKEKKEAEAAAARLRALQAGSFFGLLVNKGGERGLSSTLG